MLSASCRRLLSRGSLSVIQSRGTVVVERWWQVPLPKEGEEPYLHPRRHRIYRVLEDTKHSKKDKMELILTQTVHKLGNRGDTVTVEKALGRNKLLQEGLAVYPSPDNKQMFEEERKRQQQGAPGERMQTWTGELTVKYLKNSRLEVGIINDVQWELNKEMVARSLLKNLGVVAPLHALKIPDEPINQLGEYWCEVTVNGVDTVRIPMDVVIFRGPKPKRYRRGVTKPAAPGPESEHS